MRLNPSIMPRPKTPGFPSKIPLQSDINTIAIPVPRQLPFQGLVKAIPSHNTMWYRLSTARVGRPYKLISPRRNGSIFWDVSVDVIAVFGRVLLHSNPKVVPMPAATGRFQYWLYVIFRHKRYHSHKRILGSEIRASPPQGPSEGPEGPLEATKLRYVRENMARKPRASTKCG